MSDVTGSGGSAAGGTAEKAQEKAQEVAGQAQEKASEAAGKAQESLRSQIDDRSTEAGERVSGTAEDLRSVGEELRKQGKDGPAKLADRAAQQTEKVGSYLQEKSADDLLHDVEDFGRQRPWAIVAGGLVLGVAAARFLKASSRNRYQQRSGGSQRLGGNVDGQRGQRTGEPGRIPAGATPSAPPVTPGPVTPGAIADPAPGTPVTPAVGT